MYICIYKHIHIYICIHTINTLTYVTYVTWFICIYSYVYIFIYMYIYIYIYIYTYIYIHNTYIYIYIYTHKNTHTHAHIFVFIYIHTLNTLTPTIALQQLVPVTCWYVGCQMHFAYMQICHIVCICFVYNMTFENSNTLHGNLCPSLVGI